MLNHNDVESTMNWLSRFGKNPDDGMTRRLYTKEWLAAQQALAEKFTELGMAVRFDEVGNLYGRIEGREAGTIATGSHVDTVVDGGVLDGALGIFGGYLAVKELLERCGRPKKSIEIISMAEEEGSRFPYVFWGSKNVFGLADPADVESISDEAGVPFTEAMAECGFGFRKASEPTIPDLEVFVELHIEQGNTLEMEGKAVGVIEHIVGQRRYNISLTGEANHAGTTLMKYRRDVVQAFARIVDRAIARAKEVGDPLVLTFGKVEVEPGLVNVVPGKATFTMDCRHTDREVLQAFTAEIETLMTDIAREMKVEIEIDRYMDEEPVPMDEKIIAVVEAACEEQGLNYKKMHSGAGHDAQIFAPQVPTAMIFVPSIAGISHNPAEATKTADLLQGIEALASALHKLAY